jgi:RimJ/RimL family protein N-acetyltransferase
VPLIEWKEAEMEDEIPFPRRINSEPVEVPRGLVPARTVLTGTMVRLEPLDPMRHAVSLYRAGHSTEAALRSWDYLPWGPFATESAFIDQVRNFAAALDQIFYTVCDPVNGEAVGMASYLDIQPKVGVIEIGGIWFASSFQRTRGATEALFLMLSYAMDDLGYRRIQWRCNARNAKSRAAAKRIGFRFEGIWFNHLVVKGHNRDTAWYAIIGTEWPAIRGTINTWLDPENFGATGALGQSLSAMTAALV